MFKNTYKQLLKQLRSQKKEFWNVMFLKKRQRKENKVS